MRVLLTRPLAESLVTAQILNERNIETVIEPLFEIVEIEAIIPQGFQAVVFTSRHAVNQFAKKSEDRNLQVFCVGDKTAETAKEFGFTNVLSANGDEDDLLELIKATFQPDQGKMLRLTGYDHQDDLYDGLQQAGYDITSCQIYDVKDSDTLSAQVIEMLTTLQLAGVLFFSPKTVSRFYTLVHKHGIAASCRNLVAWCISKDAAQAINDLEFKQILVAKQPTQQALLELIF